MIVTNGTLYYLFAFTLSFLGLLLGIEYAVAVFVPISLILWWVNRASWQWLMIVFGLPILFFLQKYEFLSLQMAIAIGCGFIGACFSVLLDAILKRKKSQG